MEVSTKDKHAPTSHNFKPRYSGPSPQQLTPEQQSIRQSILNSRPNTGLNGPFGPWLSIPSIARPSQELGRAVRYGTSLSMRESELVILLTGAKFKSEAEFDIHVGEARRVGISLDVIQSIPRGRLLSEIDAEVSQKTITSLQEEEGFSLKKVKDSVVPKLEKEHDNNNNINNEQHTSNVEENKDEMANSSINSSNAKEREVAIVLFTAELLEKSTVSDETYATTKQVLDGQDSVLVEITSIIGYYAYVAYTLNVFKIPSNVKPKE